MAATDTQPLKQISVIIPTYRPKDYLWQCLDSLEGQTLDKEFFEIILSLNGPQEPYRQQIEQHIEQCYLFDIHLICTDEANVSNARNKALDAACGEYIAFVDDDDYVSPTYLESLLELATPQTIPLCYPLAFRDGTATFVPFEITTDYEKLSQRTHTPFYKARHYFAGPVYKIIHRDVIGTRRFDPHFRNGEDNLFMFLISDHFSEVAFTKKDAVYYRRLRNESASQRHRTRREHIGNSTKLIREEIKIFVKGHYNFRFFATRVLAEIKCIIISLVKQ